MNKLVAKCTAFENEEFCMLYCGNIFVHMVDHLQTESTDCTLKVLPVVKAGQDKRKDKRCDYGVYKVKNERSLIIAELKDSVDISLEMSSKSLAQLLLEIKYTQAMETAEGGVPVYKRTVGVLASACVWHILLLDIDISSFPTIVKRYVFHYELHEPGDVHQRICDTVRSLVNELYKI